MTKTEQLNNLKAQYDARPFFQMRPPEGVSSLNGQYRMEYAKRQAEWIANNPELHAEEQELYAKIRHLESQIRDEEHAEQRKDKAIDECGASKRDLEALLCLQETIAVKAVREWLKGDAGFLLISGIENSGKTIAALEALRLWVKADNRFFGSYTKFVRSVDIMRWLSFRDEQTASRIQKCKEAEFLVLDGLGTEYTNDMMRQTLFDIIDYRHGQKRRTVLTSTLPPSAMKGVESFESVYGPASMSRIKRNGKTLVLKEEIVLSKGEK